MSPSGSTARPARKTCQKRGPTFIAGYALQIGYAGQHERTLRLVGEHSRVRPEGSVLDSIRAQEFGRHPSAAPPRGGGPIAVCGGFRMSAERVRTGHPQMFASHPNSRLDRRRDPARREKRREIVVRRGGADFLRGDDGGDTMLGGDDFDDMHGNQGDDSLLGGAGDDWVVGGQGKDFVSGGDGADLVHGSRGDDTCYEGMGDDVLRGGQDSDLLYGEAGNDFLSGDRGDDTIWGGAGADTFQTFEGAGLDRIMDFSAAEGDRERRTRTHRPPATPASSP